MSRLSVSGINVNGNYNQSFTARKNNKPETVQAEVIPQRKLASVPVALIIAMSPLAMNAQDTARVSLPIDTAKVIPAKTNSIPNDSAVVLDVANKEIKQLPEKITQKGGESMYSNYIANEFESIKDYDYLNHVNNATGPIHSSVSIPEDKVRYSKRFTADNGINYTIKFVDTCKDRRREDDPNYVTDVYFVQDNFTPVPNRYIPGSEINEPPFMLDLVHHKTKTGKEFYGAFVRERAINKKTGRSEILAYEIPLPNYIANLYLDMISGKNEKIVGLPHFAEEIIETNYSKSRFVTVYNIH